MRPWRNRERRVVNETKRCARDAERGDGESSGAGNYLHYVIIIMMSLSVCNIIQIICIINWIINSLKPRRCKHRPRIEDAGGDLEPRAGKPPG